MEVVILSLKGVENSESCSVDQRNYGVRDDNNRTRAALKAY